MSEDPDDIDEAAARWHLQQDDALDWDGFTRWLEADPRHREAFDAIALIDARIDEALPTLRRMVREDAETPVLRRRHRPYRWAIAGSALAGAAALGVIFLPGSRPPSPAIYRTAPGEVRDVRLADGSSVALSPGSVLGASQRGGPVTLNGSATFDVRHDPGRLLVIRAGGYEIRDIGTRFDVAISGAILRVAVTEGSVAVRSLTADGEVQVSAGKVLTAIDPRSAPVITPIGTMATGGWRSGRLVYDDVPLGLVVADITRSTGRRVLIDSTSAKRRFSGVLATGSRDKMVGALSELTGLRKRAEHDAIRLGDGAGS